ncbi:MAG: hypothetical protein IKJ01_00185, partial [Lachnospiraceae bacterium]|nr:hypothetical protein [Lachnospiraceae bacterium]
MVNFEEKKELSKYKIIVNNTEEQDTLLSKESFKNVGDNVVLFFSFDIVNSSIYKTINYYGWSVVIDKIITELRNKVKEKITRAEVWRVLGDEVIFIVNICDIESIYEYIESIYSILINFCENIENGNFFDKIENLSHSMIHLMKIENIISLQSCAWLAAVKDKNEIKDISNIEYIENMFEIIEENKNIKFYEFIGIDIDTGFRLVEQTREKRLVLSFELAYILSKHKEFIKRLNIVTYRKLKGVWNNSAYPIIWYYDKNKHNNRKFIASFPFDAIEKDEIYVEFFSKKIFPEYMYKDVKNALKKILLDRKLEVKINRIENLIENSKNSYKQYIDNSKLELHCVAVCYNEEGKILIVKRTEREILKSKWEFGCAKANSRKQLIDTIIEEYEKDFGIQIELYI